MPAAPLVIGGNVFGWTIDEATSFAVLDAFVEAGVTMIDTADVYSAFAPGNVGGESEMILGRWMKARGEPVEGADCDEGRDAQGQWARRPATRDDRSCHRWIAQAAPDRLCRPLLRASR